MPEAFAQVALGIFALVADPASVEERDAREVRAHGTAPEKLLVNWLNECLYVMDVEGFVARGGFGARASVCRVCRAPWIVKKVLGGGAASKRALPWAYGITSSASLWNTRSGAVRPGIFARESQRVRNR